VLRAAGATLATTVLAASALASPAGAAAGPAPVLAAAGDIACAPNRPETPTACHQAETAAIVGAIDPTAVAVLGDNQYETGYLPYYQSVFDATWGAFRPKTFPVPGNHEYYRVRADGYYGYFGAAAGDPTKGYYAYDLGNWHILALNSNCTYVPCAAGSPQEQFVRSELAARPQGCTMAYWHHALFSSQGGDPRMRDIWRDLTAARVDVVLSGHNHNYERFAGQDADGRLAPFSGPREFLVGTGGRDLSAIRRAGRNSEVHQDTVFGVLALVLAPSGYAWSYDSEGGAFVDTGSTPCHDKVPPVIRLASVRPGAFRAAARGRFLAAAGGPAPSGGAVLRFRLSEPASVTFTVQRPAPGRRFRDTCLPAPRRPSGSLGCTRWIALSNAVTRRLAGGHNRLLLSGRLGGRRLAPGSYRVLTTLTDRAENAGAPAPIGFRIVR
jgi:calcineurin-like phosphoesterase family protein